MFWTKPFPRVQRDPTDKSKASGTAAQPEPLGPVQTQKAKPSPLACKKHADAVGGSASGGKDEWTSQSVGPRREGDEAGRGESASRSSTSRCEGPTSSSHASFELTNDRKENSQRRTDQKGRMWSPVLHAMRGFLGANDHRGLTDPNGNPSPRWGFSFLHCADLSWGAASRDTTKSDRFGTPDKNAQGGLYSADEKKESRVSAVPSFERPKTRSTTTTNSSSFQPSPRGGARHRGKGAARRRSSLTHRSFPGLLWCGLCWVLTFGFSTLLCFLCHVWRMCCRLLTYPMRQGVLCWWSVVRVPKVVPVRAKGLQWRSTTLRGKPHALPRNASEVLEKHTSRKCAAGVRGTKSSPSTPTQFQKGKPQQQVAVPCAAPPPPPPPSLVCAVRGKAPSRDDTKRALSTELRQRTSSVEVILGLQEEEELQRCADLEEEGDGLPTTAGNALESDAKGATRQRHGEPRKKHRDRFDAAPSSDTATGEEEKRKDRKNQHPSREEKTTSEGAAPPSSTSTRRGEAAQLHQEVREERDHSAVDMMGTNQSTRPEERRAVVEVHSSRQKSDEARAWKAEELMESFTTPSETANNEKRRPELRTPPHTARRSPAATSGGVSARHHPSDRARLQQLYGLPRIGNAAVLSGAPTTPTRLLVHLCEKYHYHPPLEVLRACVRAGANVTQRRGGRVWPVLHRFIREGHVEAVRACLQLEGHVEAGGSGDHYRHHKEERWCEEETEDQETTTTTPQQETTRLIPIDLSAVDAINDASPFHNVAYLSSTPVAVEMLQLFKERLRLQQGSLPPVQDCQTSAPAHCPPPSVTVHSSAERDDEEEEGGDSGDAGDGAHRRSSSAKVCRPSDERRQRSEVALSRKGNGRRAVDRVDWGQKDACGEDFFSLAARTQRLSVFWGILHDLPCFQHPKEVPPPESKDCADVTRTPSSSRFNVEGGEYGVVQLPIRLSRSVWGWDWNALGPQGRRCFALRADATTDLDDLDDHAAEEPHAPSLVLQKTSRRGAPYRECAAVIRRVAPRTAALAALCEAGAVADLVVARETVDGWARGSHHEADERRKDSADVTLYATVLELVYPEAMAPRATTASVGVDLSCGDAADVFFRSPDMDRPILHTFIQRGQVAAFRACCGLPLRESSSTTTTTTTTAETAFSPPSRISETKRVDTLVDNSSTHLHPNWVSAPRRALDWTTTDVWGSTPLLSICDRLLSESAATGMLAACLERWCAMPKEGEAVDWSVKDRLGFDFIHAAAEVERVWLLWPLLRRAGVPYFLDPQMRCRTRARSTPRVEGCAAAAASFPTATEEEDDPGRRHSREPDARRRRRRRLPKEEKRRQKAELLGMLLLHSTAGAQERAAWERRGQTLQLPVSDGADGATKASSPLVLCRITRADWNKLAEEDRVYFDIK